MRKPDEPGYWFQPMGWILTTRQKFMGLAIFAAAAIVGAGLGTLVNGLIG